MKYESKGSDIWPFGVNSVTVKERTCINTYIDLHTQTSILVWFPKEKAVPTKHPHWRTGTEAERERTASAGATMDPVAPKRTPCLWEPPAPLLACPEQKFT